MYTSSETKAGTLTDISNSSFLLNEKVSFTTVSTEAVADFKSPSAKKPCFFKSPGPITCGRTVCENEFLSREKPKKRTRNELWTSENKKSKMNFGPLTKLVTELYDPDTGMTTAFRCFREKEIIKEQIISESIIKNEFDDDCQTDDTQIKACVKFMSKALEEALLNHKI
ncbi:hypothetical protein SteCoe_27912 [Stentor coeruleus]|uniref:Uncharacterized protein n=1 Tax=Stentor coeruleus TaxID=5963 RepID=A0A1R2B9D6_9CILI|nr:hypothetical protein SteCoe_27912 [Stentor coeruleus]